MNKTDFRKKLPAFMNTLRFSVVLVGIAGLVIMLLLSIRVQRSLSDVQREVMARRLKTDLVCLMDDLTGEGDGVFSLRDGAVYLDGRMLGDGTEANALLDDFLHYEEKTGTFCYLFAKTGNDAELHWVGEGRYMQGHYIRVAGTTRGPDGERIEGTYIDKSVADRLEASEDGILVCEANVNGRPVYCCYRLIRDAEGEIIGILSVGRSTAEMIRMIRYFILRDILITVLLLSVIITVMLLSIRRITAIIRKIRNRLQLIGEGNLTEEPLELHAENEFNEIAESVNDMSRSLADREKIREELAIVKHDLTLAADIQRSMLTRKTFEGETRFSVCAYMKPARDVGGDFYDYFLLGDSRLAFLIADVSGKGIPAALFMMRSITALRDFLNSGLNLSEIIRAVNNNLVENNDDQFFVTAWVGILDLTDGTLRYVNAGHNRPLIKKASGEAFCVRGSSNLFLGAMEDRNFREECLMLEKGDTVFLYTDGVTEANNARQEMLTEDGLIAVAKDAPADADGLCGAVRSGVERFCGEAEQYDDITVTAVTWFGSSEAE